MIYLGYEETTTVQKVTTTLSSTVRTSSREYNMVEIMSGLEVADTVELEKSALYHIVEDMKESPGIWLIGFLLAVTLLSVLTGRLIQIIFYLKLVRLPLCLGWIFKRVRHMMQRRRHGMEVSRFGEEQMFVNPLSSDGMEMTEIRLNP